MSELRIGVSPIGAAWKYRQAARGQPRTSPATPESGGTTTAGTPEADRGEARPRLDAVKVQRLSEIRSIEVAAQNKTAALSRLYDANGAERAVAAYRGAETPSCTWTIVG